MNDIKKVLKVRNYKAGYVVKHILIDGSVYGSQDYVTRRAETPDGVYIGDPVWAFRLVKRYGISDFQTASDDSNVCSIGFSRAQNKWYGWSHRAIFGFGPGDVVKKGDCAYNPFSKDDFLDEMINFWHDEEFNSKTWGEHGERRIEYSNAVDPGNESDEEITYELDQGVWIYSLNNDKVPNKKLRNTTNSRFAPYPKFGKGKWTAKTLEDAKQMAIDFARGVS